MAAIVLQNNLNHSCQAQNLFLHTLAECGGVLGIISEPYRVPKDRTNWASDDEGTVAITWRTSQDFPPCVPVEKRPGMIVVDWGRYTIISVYISPNASMIVFEDWLEDLTDCINRRRVRPKIIAGDFNSKSQAWGSNRTDARGKMVEKWAAQNSLVLINTGKVSTCIRQSGESIIDLTWATPAAARRVADWRVAEDRETLSDHRMIEFTLSLVDNPHTRPGPSNKKNEPRWAIRRLDSDRLNAAIEAALWTQNWEGIQNTSDRVNWLQDTLTKACDLAMPKVKTTNKRPAYWWTDELTQLRRASVHANRILSRARKSRDAQRIEQAWQERKTARQLLSAAIRKAKSDAWQEALQDLDRDPWGRPYKAILSKLRARAPPLTQTMEPGLKNRVLNALFPQEIGRESPFSEYIEQDWDRSFVVTEKEVLQFAKRIKDRKAPGPDGIPGRIIKIACGILSKQMAQTFTECLQIGYFPEIWKEAVLVLLPKDGKPRDSPSAYRPICLLGEVGKLFERIIASRLTAHMNQNGDSSLSEEQFGFRQGKSTVDAVDRLKTITEELTTEGEIALAISLDVANAFNSIPWKEIAKALRNKAVPAYLYNVLQSYFQDRYIVYPNHRGEKERFEVTRGVPQGSVLGPHLWNIGYDKVLRTALPMGCGLIGYADDTLIVAKGDSWNDTVLNANHATACVTRCIKLIGLKVAPTKTEAVYMHSGNHGTPPDNVYITVEGAKIKVGSSIKYLGLLIDGKWEFRQHFAQLTPRLGKVANALSRLLPNIGGPRATVRKMYTNVLHSMMLYGAPIWAEKMKKDRWILTLVHRSQRVMAIRVARCYRTVSHRAATTLSGTPPIELLATMYQRVYRRVRALRERLGLEGVTQKEIATIRLQERRKMNIQWQRYLADDQETGRRVVDAVLPQLDRWVERSKGGITFHMAQVITNHGCFGDYLNRIGKENSAGCHHCTSRRDDADHTLARCPAWQEERNSLKEAVGNNLAIRAILGRILEEETAWQSFADFCGTVMRRKEEAERVRQGQQPAPSREREGGGASSRRGNNTAVPGVNIRGQMSPNRRPITGSNG